MFNLRRIQSDQDLEKAKSCVPEGCQPPNWKQTLLVERDGQVIGIGSAEVRHFAQVYFTKKDPAAYLMTIGCLDGMMRVAGAQQYDFLIKDQFAEHQTFVENNLPVSWDEEVGGKRYFRVLEKPDGRE